MVRETLIRAASFANSALGIASIFLMVGVSVGALAWQVKSQPTGAQFAELKQRVKTLEEHPSTAAHAEQLQITAATKILLEILERRLAEVETLMKTMKPETLADVAIRLADDRLRLSRFAGWVRRTERMNKGWIAADPYLHTRGAP